MLKPGTAFRALWRACMIPLCLLLAGPVVMLAQQARPPAPAENVEYWVTFMESFGGRGTGGVSLPELRIYVASRKPTTVSITYQRTNRTVSYNVPTADVPVEIDVSGVFGPGSELTGQEQGVSQKSFHIVAADPITLYGSTVRSASADAFLGLPLNVLTGRYIVLAYPSAYNTQNQIYDMPSEFAIVATEDSTTIRITPPVGVSLNGQSDQTFTITLNKGDVYFAQTLYNDLEDVSGTELLADKPIAVFGGNKRAGVPNKVGTSRDYLVEQIPPLDAWGNEAIVAPLYPIAPASSANARAVVRIMAAFDNTDWSMNGVPQGTLSKAKPVQVNITNTPLVIKGDQPILVALYEHSVMTGIGGPGTGEAGDPFMVIAPPKEQFDTSYTFQSIVYQEFTDHFINVVMPTAAVNSLRLDKAAVPTAFTDIPGTAYSYAQIRVSAGSHYISAAQPFGLYVYGYGNVNSYGYLGGMLFKKLVTDFFPPEIFTAFLCHQVRGLAYDSRISDSGIDTCYTTPETANANVTIQPYKKGDDSVWYTATLTDPYQDGTVGMKVIDSAGHKRTNTTPIPGFTLRAQKMTGNAPVMLDTAYVFDGIRYCRDVVLENYGAYPQTVTRATWSGDTSQVSVTTPLPVVILPGQQAVLQVCVKVKNDTMFVANLTIADSCSSRLVADMPVLSQVDTLPPAVSKPTPCTDVFNLSFNDAKGSGIAAISVDTIGNGTITFSPPLSGLPAQLVNGAITWADRRQDLVYQITVTDRRGNTTVVRDTLGGFTLLAVNKTGDTLGARTGRVLDVDTVALNTSRCIGVRVLNYGLRPLHIDNATLRSNLSYSIPPSQFPLVIRPGDSALVQVCILGRGNQVQTDTLLLTDDCGMTESVAMAAPTASLLGIGRDGCSTTLFVNVFAPSKRTFISVPKPNPVVTGMAVVDIGLRQPETVRIDLVDSYGRNAARLVDDRALPGGLHRMQMELHGLPAGAYMLRMHTSDGVCWVKMIVGQ